MTTTTEEPIVRGAGYRLSTSAGGTHEPVLIDLDAIRTDGGTQARAGLDDATVAEYAATWQDLSYQQNGLSKIPPIVLYHDGESYWLADGFHRVAAYKQFLGACPLTAAPRALLADVQSGTRRDAVLYACGANASHGLKRTPADKRRAVERLLRDEEWRQWNDSEIARRCQVSHTFVGNIRKELYPATLQDSRTVDRGGTTYLQKPPAPKPNTPPPDNGAQPVICRQCGGEWGAPGSTITGERGFICAACLKRNVAATLPPPTPADVPHLPPDFADAQRRAERIGLTLSMNMHGRFDLRDEVNGAGLVGFRDWSDALGQLARMEAATATRDAAPAPEPAQQRQFVTDPLAPIRTSLARVTRWLAQLAGELESLADAPDVADADYEALAAPIGAARRALESEAT